MFLVTSGAKRRVIDVLNNMGLTSGYATLQALMKDIAKRQMEGAIEMAKDEQTYVVYDNFNR